MKKILTLACLIFVCAIFIPKVLAFDNYIVHTSKPVQKVSSSDENVIVANILVTIMNEKDTILISPKGLGKAILMFTFKDEVIEIPVTVKKNRAIFKKNQKLNFIKMDPPPVLFQIDLPPMVEGSR